MKDVVSVFNRVLRWNYSAVNTSPRDTFECPQTPTQTAIKALSGKYRTPLLIVFLGIASIFSGVFIILVRPYDTLFRWKCVFGDGGEIFDLWRTPPVDLYLRVFLWNVTNKDEFLSGQDEKLKVTEVGPYVYKEMFIHDNVVFNDNATITTTPRHPLVWMPELSEGRQEDDLLILPNIALLSIAHVVSDESYFTKVGLNLLIRQTKTEPLIQMTAKEFMFGYSSTLMTLGNKFMPKWIYFDKLGLIDRMYDFEGDYETVFTGEDDIKKTGLIDTYRGSKELPQWESPCGSVHGASDGAKFAGYIEPNDTLLFFRKSMCRAKRLIRFNTTSHSGLDAHFYRFDDQGDDNGAVHPENQCFCKKEHVCLPPGMQDVQGCYYGFPIALSNPHFLDTDPIALARVEGMQPDPEKHLSYFYIEPQSGLPLDLAARYQINMALGSIKTIANVDKFNNMVLPLLWGEIRLYSLPDMLITRFRLYLKVLPVAEVVLKYIFFSLSGCLFLFAIYRFIHTKSNKYHKNHWMEDDFVINMERKLSSYVPEKRASMNAKELEVYFSSLVTPLNQNITFHDFQEMKEEDV